MEKVEPRASLGALHGMRKPRAHLAAEDIEAWMTSRVGDLEL